MFTKSINKLIFKFLWSGKTQTINRATLFLPKDRGDLGITDLEIRLPALQLKRLQSITSPLIEEKWIYFARYWIGRKLSKVHPSWSFLGANNTPHFDLLKPSPLPKFYQLFSECLDKLKTNIDDLQKESFTTKAIYTTLEQQRNVRPSAESRWSALGRIVASWASVWNSCFDDLSLGLENDIILISHWVVKTGMYLKYKLNMTTVNEFCTICNASENIEHLFKLYSHCAHLEALFSPAEESAPF